MKSSAIARDVFAFLMVGLLITLASEETKVIDTSIKAVQKTEMATPKAMQVKQVSINETANKCFDVNFPIQVISPDGVQQTVDTERGLDKFVIDWFDNNPNSNKEPTFLYPFEITLENGDHLWIKNEAHFLLVADACDEQILQENFASVNTFCFEFIYPIELVAPNGKIRKANTAEQVDQAIQQWNHENPNSKEELVIQFPIKIKFDDGVVIQLEEVNSLQSALQFCENDSLEYDASEDEVIEKTKITTPIIGA